MDKKKRWGRFLLHTAIVLAMTFVLLLIYLFAAHLRYTPMFWIYFVALCFSALGYVVWNRGFWRSRVRREELPQIWSEEDKDFFFAEAAAWRRHSAWLLYLLVIPLALTFFYDILSLWCGDALSALFPFLQEGGL